MCRDHEKTEVQTTDPVYVCVPYRFNSVDLCRTLVDTVSYYD